uniref:EF-hand domain-containing protein n=1 Tax=Setaria digitata TaxID=48799 RepID=A0A915Q769_9BILA
MKQKTNQTTETKEKESEILLELNFTADELRALYRAFKDVLPICRDSFREVYANIFPHGDVEQFADLIFDSLAQQAEHVTFTVIWGTMEEKLNWMYRLYDPRDTGKIELERILTIITATDDLIGTKAAPVISLDEREKQARQIVQKFDLQKKGWISREDFMTVCSQDQSILQSISALCSTNTLTI